jgi:predicted dinucleotide-binding enzyme
MKIAIIGSGNIGGPLGRLWAAAGHQVRFGSRNPGRLTALVDTITAAGGDAGAASVVEAAAFGEVVLEAIPFAALPDLPLAELAGKPLLSAANYYPQRDGEIDLRGLSQSEWAALQLPGVRLVKAFNMMRAGVIEALAEGGGTPGIAILLAGDDATAKGVAGLLVRDAKFEPVDAGQLSAGRLFQSPDAPLYDVRLAPADVRAKLAGLAAGEPRL